MECSSTSDHNTAGHRSPRLVARGQVDWLVLLVEKGGSKNEHEWNNSSLHPLWKSVNVNTVSVVML